MGRHVLFVEDEIDIRTVIGTGLKFMGLEVTAVESAEEALKKLKFESFDIILLDMSLPGMSGWDFAKKVRKKLQLEIPIIALTGASKVGDEQKAYVVGCNGFIPKPVEPKVIKRKIDDLLAKGRTL